MSADPEPSALIPEQEAVPAHDPRIAGLRQREARDACARDDADAPATGQRASMGRDRIVGEPHLGHSDRIRNKSAQAVGDLGVSGRGREPEHGPVHLIESSEQPSCGHGIRQRPDGVASSRPSGWRRAAAAALRESRSRGRVDLVGLQELRSRAHGRICKSSSTLPPESL